jgi:hypothetical protein
VDGFLGSLSAAQNCLSRDKRARPLRRAGGFTPKAAPNAAIVIIETTISTTRNVKGDTGGRME